jgi:hypothetical protein
MEQRVNLPRYAQRDRRSRRADARCRVSLVTFIDVNSAARASHGDKLLAEAADEVAPGAARWRVECMQATHAGGAGWSRWTRRSGRSDVAARTVRTARAGCPWRTLFSRGPWRSLGSRRALFSFGTWRSRIAFCALRSWRTRAKQKGGDESCNCDWLAHRIHRSFKTSLSLADRSVNAMNAFVEQR